VEFISSIYNFNYIFDQFSIFKLNKFDVGDLPKIYQLGNFQNKAELYFSQNFRNHFIFYYLSKKKFFSSILFSGQNVEAYMRSMGMQARARIVMTDAGLELEVVPEEEENR
jgi:hypothetical protein